MPSIVSPRVSDNTKLYSKRYTQFKGADFSTDPTQVGDSRSPMCQNLISDLAGFPEKRPGWRVLQTVDAPINGLFFVTFASGATAYIAHGGAKLYSWTPTGTTLLYSSMNTARSTAFAHKGKLYILDGAHYLVCTESAGTITVARVKDGACFIPTTIIGAKAAGGGTAFEGVNMLTPKRKNSMIGDGSATVFHLDSTNIDAVDSVTVNGTLYTSGTQYTVSLTAGTVTFTTAPPAYTGGSGVDNIIIQFQKTVTGYLDKVEKCTICTTYGYNNDNRFFITGNPDAPNVDYQSGLDDPTYFPDTGYTKVGADTSPIMGYLKQYSTLIVVKGDSSDAEIYLRTAEMSNSTVIFPTVQGIKGAGAISKYAFAALRDDPMFLSREGVYSIVSTLITQQRVLQNRSFYVDSKLTKETGLDQAIATTWNGYYVLCVNGHCYIADARQRTGNSLTEQYGYEWYYWTNIPARVFLEQEGDLYFGTVDGQICRFNTDIEGMSRYNDNGQAIIARWSTKADDLGTLTRRKTVTKKGAGVMIKPYSHSSVKVYVATEAVTEHIIRQALMDIFSFDDINFERFTFNTRDAAQVVAFNAKIKKFVTLQLIFENDALNEGWGVFGAQIQYAIANYVK